MPPYEKYPVNFNFFNLANKNNSSITPREEICDESENCIALIYPFKFKKIDIKKLNSQLEDNEWEDVGFVLSNCSRFYNYITDKFTTTCNKDFVAIYKRQNVTTKLRKEINNAFIDEHDDPKKFKNDNKFWTQEREKLRYYNCKSDYKEPILVKPIALRILTIDSGVGLFCIFFDLSTTSKNPLNDYNLFEINQALKEVARSKKFENWLTDYFMSNFTQYSPVFFEDKRTKIHSTRNTLRATIFANINILSNRNVDKSLIPYWFSGSLAVKTKFSKDVIKKLESKSMHLTPLTKLTSTSEGCCLFSCINPLDSKAVKYMNKNALYFCQHVFFIYALNLLQLYFLHSITEKASNIPTKSFANLKLFRLFDDFEKDYIKFKKCYMFHRISAVEKYHKAYTYTQKQLDIELFNKEIVDTFLPIRKCVDEKIQSRRTFFISFITFSSLVSALISIFDIVFSKQTTVQNTVLPVLVITITGVVLYAFLLPKNIFYYAKKVFVFICSSIKKLFKRKKR